MISMYKNKKFIIGVIILFSLLGLFYYFTAANSYPDAIHGTIIGYTNGKQGSGVNKVDVKITSGNHKGTIISVENYSSSHINDEDSNTLSYASPGQEVLLNIQNLSKDDINTAYIFEIVRYKVIYELIAVFIVLLLLAGGLKGLKAIYTLIITGILVIKVMMPLILIGANPIILSIIICMAVTIINLLILNGKSKKTYAAIIGTVGGLFISGAVALIANSIIKVKGLPDEQIQSLIFSSHNAKFNFGGLLFAGIIMGALGAVMDVSISIASSMKEIKEARPEISSSELIKSGMNIGQDIMGTMSNTLILAYVGSAMYLMLMISSGGMGLSQTINQDTIASELLRGLAGSIGLIFSIPITALTYAFLTNLKGKNQS